MSPPSQLLTPQQILWSDWQREDGTNTTWQYDVPDAPNIIRTWEKNTSSKRRRMARETKEVELPDGLSAIHEYATVESANALEEKWTKSQRSLDLTRYANWDNTIKRPTLESDCSSQAAEGRLALHNSRVRVTHSQLLSGGSHILSYQSRTRSLSTHLAAPIAKRRRIHQSEIISPAEQRTGSPSMRREDIQELEQQWKRLCQNAGAAEISILSDSRTTDNLPVKAGFRYLEQMYRLQLGLHPPDPEFLVSCDCPGPCEDASSCHCQSMADEDNHGQQTYAYDHKVRPNIEQ